MTGANVIHVAGNEVNLNPKHNSVSGNSNELFIVRDGEETSLSLLEGLRAKSRNAWIDLDHLYRPLLEKWCEDIGVPTHDWAEVTNAIFAKIHQGIDAYKHYSFRGWLRRITYTQAMDYFRRQSGIQAVGGSDANDLIEQLPEPEPGPHFETSAVYTASEQRLLLLQARAQVLAGCTERTREIFTRVVEQQESPSAVAKEFGLKVDRIYSLRAQVLKRMRLALEGLLNVDDDLSLPASPPPNTPT